LELGFNRLSFGVQDFDPEVQKAVHRIQPAEQVDALVGRCTQALDFESVDVDLIYGLPKQTPESFRSNTMQAGATADGQIALRLYAYAHLPATLQTTASHCWRHSCLWLLSKTAMLSRRYGGVDECVATCMWAWTTLRLPEDALAVGQTARPLASKLSGLQRPQPDCDLIGLGVSAIGRMAGAPTAKTPKPWKSMWTCSTPASCPS
jgi:oxygen-independent coproporphyrinogen-3 oxidase